MFKVYILLSNPSGFFRHFSPDYSNLSPEDAEIVINTNDPDSERDLVHLCKKFNVTYHITKSNGTPAKGKNELLKVFLNSDNKYMVQIDGDDYLTPYGVWLYKHIASLKSVPDAICIKNGVALCMVGKIFEDAEKQVRRFFTIDWDKLNYDEIKDNMLKLYVPKDQADKYTEYHRTFYTQQSRFCEGNDTHNRVVFYSRKAAELVSFNEKYTVGEDTLHYLELKHQHMQGNLTFVCNDEAPATYVYNQVDMTGTVWKTTKGFTRWEWMREFNLEVERREKDGTVYEKQLPLLKIHYTGEEDFNDLQTAGLVRYSTQDKYLELPANASFKCRDELLNSIGKSIEK
jgi:hypothetical protein